MIKLFNEYKNEGKIKEALLVGRNMVNKEPGNYEYLRHFLDLLFNIAEALDSIEEKSRFVAKADITLSFFEENADLSREMIDNITVYRAKIDDLRASLSEYENCQNSSNEAAIVQENSDQIQSLYIIIQKINETKSEEEFDQLLKEISVIDSRIQQDYLTAEQTDHYNYLNRECTNIISNKMREFEYLKNVDYNKKAVVAFESAFKKFRNDEATYKNHSQLFSLASSTLFAFDAAKLFNETLIYYNHVYSYIFSKLDEDGKLALTRFSIECERKQG